jgi:hypothetical protein
MKDHASHFWYVCVLSILKTQEAFSSGLEINTHYFRRCWISKISETKDMKKSHSSLNEPNDTETDEKFESEYWNSHEPERNSNNQ